MAISYNMTFFGPGPSPINITSIFPQILQSVKIDSNVVSLSSTIDGGAGIVHMNRNVTFLPPRF